MLSLRFNGFDPKKTVALIRPRCTSGILLVVNLITKDGEPITEVGDVSSLAILTRRFGTLVGVHKTLRKALSGSERKVSGESTHMRYGHIYYQRRSTAELAGSPGRVNLMTPVMKAKWKGGGFNAQ